MLILGRRVGEKIIIGDNITVTMCAIIGGQIRVGIDAPKEVSVHREEIYLKCKKDANFKDVEDTF